MMSNSTDSEARTVLEDAAERENFKKQVRLAEAKIAGEVKGKAKLLKDAIMLGRSEIEGSGPYKVHAVGIGTQQAILFARAVGLPTNLALRVGHIGDLQCVHTGRPTGVVYMVEATNMPKIDLVGGHDKW
jgi:hypothetical protein